MRRIAAFFALILAFGYSTAWAQLPARPEGPIADYANVLTGADKATLDARLREYNQATGRAIIVATVPTLDGEEIEPYAQKLAESWDIGGATSENGVLLLVAPAERKVRIHTARGVQERMTDIMSGRIIRNSIVPEFRSGNMSGGIIAGVDAIIAQLDMDPAQAKAIEEAQATANRQRQGKGGIPIGALFWLPFLFLFFVLPMMRGRGRRRRARRGSPWGNTARDIILWEAGSAIARGMFNSGGGGGGGFGGGGFGGFGGGGGGFNGGGASGGW